MKKANLLKKSGLWGGVGGVPPAGWQLPADSTLHLARLRVTAALPPVPPAIRSRRSNAMRLAALSLLALASIALHAATSPSSDPRLQGAYKFNRRRMDLRPSPGHACSRSASSTATCWLAKLKTSSTSIGSKCPTPTSATGTSSANRRRRSFGRISIPSTSRS